MDLRYLPFGYFNINYSTEGRISAAVIRHDWPGSSRNPPGSLINTQRRCGACVSMRPLP